MLKRRPPEGSVRRVRHIGRNIPGITVNKNHQTIQKESATEGRLLLRLLRDETVADYDTQSLTFTFLDEDGKWHSYTPDVKLWRTNGETELHEVAIDERRQSLNARRREKAGKEYCEARGWRYFVHDEADLPTGTELVNLQDLSGYRPRCYREPSVASALFRRLSNGETARVGQLISEIASEVGLHSGVVASTIFHLLWHKYLEADLTKIIIDGGRPVPGTVIRMSKEGRSR